MRRVLVRMRGKGSGFDEDPGECFELSEYVHPVQLCGQVAGAEAIDASLSVVDRFVVEVEGLTLG